MGGLFANLNRLFYFCHFYGVKVQWIYRYFLTYLFCKVSKTLISGCSPDEGFVVLPAALLGASALAWRDSQLNLVRRKSCSGLQALHGSFLWTFIPYRICRVVIREGMLGPWHLHGSSLSPPEGYRTSQSFPGGDVLGLAAFAGALVLALAWEVPLKSCTLQDLSDCSWWRYAWFLTLVWDLLLRFEFCKICIVVLNESMFEPSAFTGTFTLALEWNLSFKSWTLHNVYDSLWSVREGIHMASTSVGFVS